MLYKQFLRYFPNYSSDGDSLGIGKPNLSKNFYFYPGYIFGKTQISALCRTRT